MRTLNAARLLGFAFGISPPVATNAPFTSQPRNCKRRPHQTGTVSFGEPIRSGYVLVKRDRLTNVTSLEHERWKRAHPKFCRKMGIE